MKNLKNKIAVVTGATSGIGMAISLALLEQGASVYLLGRNFTKLKAELSDEIRFEKNKYWFIKTDLSDIQDLSDIVDEFMEQNQIDILIHCAGVISIGLMEHENIDNLDEQYNVNVRAPYYLSQKLLSKLKETKGDIVFINSTAALDSWETVGQYASTKYAARALADSLRKELKNDGVRVSSLYLGSVDTPMQKKVQKIKNRDSYSSEQYMSPEVIADLVVYILGVPHQACVTDVTIRQNM